MQASELQAEPEATWVPSSNGSDEPGAAVFSSIELAFVLPSSDDAKNLEANDSNFSSGANASAESDDLIMAEAVLRDVVETEHTMAVVIGSLVGVNSTAVEVRNITSRLESSSLILRVDFAVFPLPGAKTSFDSDTIMESLRLAGTEDWKDALSKHLKEQINITQPADSDFTVIGFDGEGKRDDGDDEPSDTVWAAASFGLFTLAVGMMIAALRLWRRQCCQQAQPNGVDSSRAAERGSHVLRKVMPAEVQFSNIVPAQYQS